MRLPAFAYFKAHGRCAEIERKECEEYNCVQLCGTNEFLDMFSTGPHKKNNNKHNESIPNLPHPSILPIPPSLEPTSISDQVRKELSGRCSQAKVYNPGETKICTTDLTQNGRMVRYRVQHGERWTVKILDFLKTEGWTPNSCDMIDIHKKSHDMISGSKLLWSESKLCNRYAHPIGIRTPKAVLAPWRTLVVPNLLLLRCNLVNQRFFLRHEGQIGSPKKHGAHAVAYSPCGMVHSWKLPLSRFI